MLRPATCRLISLGRRVSTWTPLATAFNAKNSGLFDFNFKRKETDEKRQLMLNLEEKKRMNSVVITGRTYIANDKEEFMKNLQTWLKNNLQVEPKIEDAWRIGDRMQERIILKCETWQDKQLILNNKFKLKGTNIFIDHDYTKEERERQRIIKYIVKCLRQDGKTDAKVSYGKLYVNGDVWKWDEIMAYYEEKMGLKKKDV